ncbi:MAG TPA: hypothetical protein VGC67_02585 [Cellulomonas sp.]
MPSAPTVLGYLRDQPEVLLRAAAPLDAADALAVLGTRAGSRTGTPTGTRVLLVGSGSSATAARAVLGAAAALGLDADVRVPLDVLHERPLTSGTVDVLVAVSQSGRSRRVRDVLARARALGVATVLVTGDRVRGQGVADLVVDVRVGPELVGATTKGWTATVTTLHQVVAALAGAPRPAGLDGAVAAVARALDHEGAVRDWARRLPDPRSGVLLAADCALLAAAAEGALKVQEIARVGAQAWDVEELVHGPHRRVAPGTPVVLLDSGLGDVPPALPRWLRSAGAHLLHLRTGPDDPRDPGPGPAPLSVGPVPPSLAAVPAVVPLQLAAIAVADVLGLAPEEPLHADLDLILDRKDCP